jgi:hypothetical protein
VVGKNGGTSTRPKQGQPSKRQKPNARSLDSVSNITQSSQLHFWKAWSPITATDDGLGKRGNCGKQDHSSSSILIIVHINIINKIIISIL